MDAEVLRALQALLDRLVKDHFEHDERYCSRDQKHESSGCGPAHVHMYLAWPVLTLTTLHRAALQMHQFSAIWHSQPG
jgi:hypothetical protein